MTRLAPPLDAAEAFDQVEDEVGAPAASSSARPARPADARRPGGASRVLRLQSGHGAGHLDDVGLGEGIGMVGREDRGVVEDRDPRPSPALTARPPRGRGQADPGQGGVQDPADQVGMADPHPSARITRSLQPGARPGRGLASMK